MYYFFPNIEKEEQSRESANNLRSREDTNLMLQEMK